MIWILCQLIAAINEKKLTVRIKILKGMELYFRMFWVVPALF
jgi:hypothetical protein